MSTVFLNDFFLDEDEAKVSINDSGYYYGDGFYEVILLYNGKLIDKELHFDRLMANFRRLYFKNYPSRDNIISIVREVIKKNKNKKNGSIYIQFTRGCTQRTHEFRDLNLKPNMLVKINDLHKNNFNADVQKWNCCIIEDPRRMNCEIKMISLLPMVLAKYEAENNGYDDVIFYNSRFKTVSEGSSFNVFIVNQDGKIVTCPICNCILPGCTRMRVVKILKDNGYEIEERFYSKEELYNAKEVFLTASLKINAITCVDGKRIYNGDAGEVTNFIRSKYLEFLESYIDE